MEQKELHLRLKKLRKDLQSIAAVNKIAINIRYMNEKLKGIG